MTCLLLKYSLNLATLDSVNFWDPEIPHAALSVKAAAAGADDLPGRTALQVAAPIDPRAVGDGGILPGIADNFKAV